MFLFLFFFWLLFFDLVDKDLNCVRVICEKSSGRGVDLHKLKLVTDRNGHNNTFLARQMQLSYRLWYFGLPISVSCPIYRNVNDEECLLWYRSRRGVHVFRKLRMAFT